MTQQGLFERAAMSISFEVLGKPITQGSTRTVPVRKKGGGYRTREDGRPMLVPMHDNAEKLQTWRQEVAHAAQAAREVNRLSGPFIGAIRLELEFHRPRPKYHFGTGRNAGKLKESAPEYPTRTPDTVKLTRSVEDAITGILWIDDAQIVDHVLKKRWGDFGVAVTVESLDGRTRES